MSKVYFTLEDDKVRLVGEVTNHKFDGGWEAYYDVLNGKTDKLKVTVELQNARVENQEATAVKKDSPEKSEPLEVQRSAKVKVDEVTIGKLREVAERLGVPPDAVVHLTAIQSTWGSTTTFSVNTEFVLNPIKSPTWVEFTWSEKVQ